MSNRLLFSDDNNHMPKLLDFLVQTKFEPGLTGRDTQKALRILLGSVPNT